MFVNAGIEYCVRVGAHDCIYIGNFAGYCNNCIRVGDAFVLVLRATLMLGLNIVLTLARTIAFTLVIW